MKIRKVILTVVWCIGLALSADAQTPPMPGRDSFSSANQVDKSNSVKGPLAPATFLLLALAGGFAGVKIYANNKTKEE